jgi:tetratricopeptide (TPR) repeat protein
MRVLCGRRQEALAAWARVAPTDRSFARAVQFQASNMIPMGKYSRAEDILLQGMASPVQSRSYDLKRELINLYRLEGRFRDMRRLLRASWCRSTDAVGVLRELWMLDHTAIPVEVCRFALDHAEDGDDWVWLGRAHLATQVGRFPDAARWLERCLERRPEDPSVWLAPIQGLLIEYRRRAVPRFGADVVLEHHGRILAAVEAGDPERARRAMREHIELSTWHIKEYIRLYGFDGRATDRRPAVRVKLAP